MVSAFILHFKHLKCSNTQTHTDLCEYISFYIWVPLDAGRGSGYCLEPMKRRGKPISLHHTYIPRITFNFLPFIFSCRAYCQDCIGMRFYSLFLNYKVLKNISRRDRPSPHLSFHSLPWDPSAVATWSPFPRPPCALIIPHCAYTSTFPSTQKMCSFIFSNSGVSPQCSAPHPPHPPYVYTILDILTSIWCSVQWEVVYNTAVESVNSGARLPGCDSSSTTWKSRIKYLMSPCLKFFTSGYVRRIKWIDAYKVLRIDLLSVN